MRNPLSKTNGMFVLKANDSRNPFGDWSFQLSSLGNGVYSSVHHGVPFEINNELYFVWTTQGWYTQQIMNIVKMEGPRKIDETADGAVLRLSDEGWQCKVVCTVYAPLFLQKADKIYMIFSGSTPTVPEAAIGYMSINIGLDPLNISNWETVPGPAFQSCPEENVYSTKFAEFTTSQDGTETWMLYAASSNSSDIVGSSRLRVAKIDWDPVDGSPRFPAACGENRDKK